MEIVKLLRFSSGNRFTLGCILIDDAIQCFTLELPFVENRKNVSCIPLGLYQVAKRYSARYQRHFQLLNVPNRSYILIHAGNFLKNTQGCILVGSGIDLNGYDGFPMLVHSKKSLFRLLRLLDKPFLLEVSDVG